MTKNGLKEFYKTESSNMLMPIAAFAYYEIFIVLWLIHSVWACKRRINLNPL